MNDDLERINLSGGTEENHKIPVRISEVSAEIRTEPLLDMCQERSRYASLYGGWNIIN
jgi:hypothetical protein